MNALNLLHLLVGTAVGIITIAEKILTYKTGKEKDSSGLTAVDESDCESDDS